MEPDVPHGDWRASLEAHSEGILFVPPTAAELPPAAPQIDGRRYVRFMDRVLLPAAVDHLDPEQIAVVNVLRRRLVESGHADRAHAVVKEGFRRYLQSTAVRRLVEWGPGFDPLGRSMELDTYLAVDLDQAMVDHCRSIAISCTSPDMLRAGRVEPTFQAIVAAFVFHFSISTEDVQLMKALLEPTGIVIANVYKRSGPSTFGLQSTFENNGFRVVRESDPSRLCDRHEYWLASLGRSGRELEAESARLLDVLGSVA